MKLSPYGFDVGRVITLLSRPNVGYPRPDGPHDRIFPEEGYILLRGVASRQDCASIRAEYDRFEALREQEGCRVKDDHGRNYRLVNYHLVCHLLRKIGLDERVHDLAGRFFGQTAMIYTSLYFKHGSQQRPHIDTPFFWTQPMNLFCGVWLALEDIAPDAGPLIYYPGSHRYFSDPEALARYYSRANEDVQVMFELMENDIRSDIQPALAEIQAGDIFIWHPGLMHGGSAAKNPSKTRHSVVFHLSPLGVNVRDQSRFLKPFLNLPKYGVAREDGKYYARGSLPSVML